MGGFAVAIDWKRHNVADQIDPMLDLIPHRSTEGSATAVFDHAALGEARTDPHDGPTTVTSLGRFSIVGDLRLWNRQGLRSRAGGTAATTGMDDRELILAAYCRTGIGFLDDLDGDFAFVIWDEERRRVLAVRDRFAAKPLFYHSTVYGVRFATEIKQLVATASHPPRPNNNAVAEYLSGRFVNSQHTFFNGISKVAPAEYVLATPTRPIERRYWPSPIPAADFGTQAEVAAEFRHHLSTAVQRRLSTTQSAVAHVTGGLDSPSIVTAAAELTRADDSTASIETVSAVFPGSEADESEWIHAITADLPFRHHEFEPAPESVEQDATVMWQTDSPIHNRIRGIWSGTAAIARNVGANLVLMGSGGDEVLDQSQLLVDLLRQGAIRQWWYGVGSEAAWHSVPRFLPAGRSIGSIAPARLKGLVRRRSRPRSTNLASADLVAAHQSQETDPRTAAPYARSLTQQIAERSTRSPLRALINESQEAEFSHEGIGVTYPFMDRHVVEFLASIPPRLRPIDGSNKALLRMAYADRLPPTILDRRTKTVADTYLSVVFDRLMLGYRSRYPDIAHHASAYIDRNRYSDLMQRAAAHELSGHDRRGLWDAWTLMLWLDGFSRYTTGDG